MTTIKGKQSSLVSSSCNDLLRRCPWRSRNRRLCKLCFRRLEHSWRQDLCEPPVRDQNVNQKNQVNCCADYVLVYPGQERGNELGSPLILSMPFPSSVSKFKESMITST